MRQHGSLAASSLSLALASAMTKVVSNRRQRTLVAVRLAEQRRLRSTAIEGE